MDVQELNRACELAFLVAREGVEQDPPIDPPAPMRMFLYVREFPQRAITVARQVLAEDEEFRRRVADRADVESVGETALNWLNRSGVLEADDLELTIETGDEPSPPPGDGPVTKEAIRSELDELKSLVGQLSEERQAVNHEVHELELSLNEPGYPMPDMDVEPATTASSSLLAQVRSLHTDLKQARMERDHAQEAKELAIIEQAELTTQLEQLRSLAASTEMRLGDLEAQITQTTAAREAAEADRRAIEAERVELLARADSMEGERDQVVAEKEAIAIERTAIEQRLAAANDDIDRLNTELDDARANAGASVSELRAALSASEALGARVEQLSGVQQAGRLEMERVNAALADQAMSSDEKVRFLQSALHQVVGERDSLAGKLELVRAAVSSVQTEVATLDSSVSDAEHAAGTLGTQVEELRTSVEGLRVEPIEPADLSVFDPADIVGEASVPGAPEAPPVDDGGPPVVDPLFAGTSQTLDVEHQESSEPEQPNAGVAAEFLPEPDVHTGEELPGEAAPELDVEGADAPPTAQDQPVAAEPPEEVVSDESFPSDTVDTSEWAVATFAEEPAGDEPHEDLDEVHALVAETVASFEPGEKDALPGAGLDAETAAEAVGARTDRGGLASLFSSFAPPAETAESDGGLTSEASHGAFELDEDAGARDEALHVPEAPPEHDAEPEGSATRTPIDVPEDLSGDPVGMARHVVQSEDAVLLVDGDPVAALGWPTVDRVDQRRNLVHFLHALAGSSGVAPDVLLDRDHGSDRLPDSRSVRVRITDEGGSVSAQILTLIDSYPPQWPVVVVTDDRDLAAEAAMKGATILDNGQLLDLFIAS